MAYSTSNPPQLVAQSVGGGHREWAYRSTDPIATVRVTGYFSNGYHLGMRPGDLVRVVDTDSSPVALQLCVVNDVSATTGVADIGDGVAVTATDTD